MQGQVDEALQALSHGRRTVRWVDPPADGHRQVPATRAALELLAKEPPMSPATMAMVVPIKSATIRTAIATSILGTSP